MTTQDQLYDALRAFFADFKQRYNVQGSADITCEYLRAVYEALAAHEADQRHADPATVAVKREDVETIKELLRDITFSRVYDTANHGCWIVNEEGYSALMRSLHILAAALNNGSGG